MRSKIIQHITKATLCAAMLLAAGFAQPVNAQAGIQGKFSLPHETRWGQAVLPPGDYQLTLNSDNMSATLVIRDAKSLRLVAFESVNIREDSTDGTSALLIGTQGTRWVVYSLQLAELGEAFVYERPPAHGRAAEEARQTQAIPIVVAKK